MCIDVQLSLQCGDYYMFEMCLKIQTLRIRFIKLLHGRVQFGLGVAG